MYTLCCYVGEVLLARFHGKVGREAVMDGEGDEGGIGKEEGRNWGGNMIGKCHFACRKCGTWKR